MVGADSVPGVRGQACAPLNQGSGSTGRRPCCSDRSALLAEHFAFGKMQMRVTL